MATSTAEIERRLRAAEIEIERMKARIARLEKGESPGVENPTDRTTVREKVAYDWQH